MSVVEIIVTKKPNCLEGQEVGERNEFSNSQIGYDICKFRKSTQVNNNFPSRKCSCVGSVLCNDVTIFLLSRYNTRSSHLMNFWNLQ